MSKVVKNLIMRDYKARITKGTEQWPDAMVISIRGMNGARDAENNVAVPCIHRDRGSTAAGTLQSCHTSR